MAASTSERLARLSGCPNIPEELRQTTTLGDDLATVIEVRPCNVAWGGDKYGGGGCPDGGAVFVEFRSGGPSSLICINGCADADTARSFGERLMFLGQSHLDSGGWYGDDSISGLEVWRAFKGQVELRAQMCFPGCIWHGVVNVKASGVAAWWEHCLTADAAIELGKHLVLVCDVLDEKHG